MNLVGRDWDRFNGNYALPENRSMFGAPARIWRHQVLQNEQILSLDERERADRFRFDADRRRSVIGRGCLRLLLGKILSFARELRFEYDEFGKPGLIPAQGPRFAV